MRTVYRLLWGKLLCGIIVVAALTSTSHVAIAATVGECLDQSYDPSAAKVCQELVDNGSSAASIFLRLAQALNGTGKRAESYSVLEQGLAKNPGNTALSELKAIVRSNLTEQEYLDAQNEKGPSARATTNAKLRILRIRCLKKQNQEALDACNEFATLGGQDADVSARQASLLASLTPIPEPEPEVAREPRVIDLTPSAPVTSTVTPADNDTTRDPATTTPTTTPTPNPTATAQSKKDTDEYYQRIDLVKSIQTKLNNLGFAAGTPDGFSGANTRRAISDFYATTAIGSRQDIGQSLLDDLERAEQLQSEVAKIYRESEQALQNGNIDRATDLFDTARSTASWAPVIAGLSNRLANARAAERNADEEKRKKDTIAKIKSLLRNNNLDIAKQQLDSALQRNPADENLLALRDEYQSAIRQQQQAAAEQLASKRRDESRNESIDQSIAKATAQFSNGDLDQALASLSEAEQLAPESDRVANLRNRILKEQQRQAESTRAAQNQKRQVASLVEQASQALDRGELDNARNAINEARAVDPEFRISSDMQARIDAQEKRDTDSASALQILADAQNAITNDQLDKAENLVSQAQALDSSLPAADELLTKISKRRSELESIRVSESNQQSESEQTAESQQRLASLLQRGKVLQDARVLKLSNQPDYFTDELPASIGKLFAQ